MAIMTNNMQKETNLTAGLLAYEGVQMSAVLGLADVFKVAARIGVPLGAKGLAAAVLPYDALSDGRLDVVIVPPGIDGARGQDDAGTHAWLRAQAGQGALMCSVCAGAYWLGHAGLLSGRSVTTHWALADDFARAFPAVMVAAGHMLIDDGDLITAGGVMAWVDLGLHLVERVMGGEVMARTARHLLVDPPRRAQSHYQRFMPARGHGDSQILMLQNWLDNAFARPVSNVEMALRAGCSERSLLRRFSKATGLNPHQYVQQLRIERARGMLERGRLPVDEVSFRVGYHDTSAFVRVFRQITGLSPGAYRKRFFVNQA